MGNQQSAGGDANGNVYGASHGGGGGGRPAPHSRPPPPKPKPRPPHKKPEPPKTETCKNAATCQRKSPCAKNSIAYCDKKNGCGCTPCDAGQRSYCNDSNGTCTCIEGGSASGGGGSLDDAFGAEYFSTGADAPPSFTLTVQTNIAAATALHELEYKMSDGLGPRSLVTGSPSVIPNQPTNVAITIFPSMPYAVTFTAQPSTTTPPTSATATIGLSKSGQLTMTASNILPTGATLKFTTTQTSTTCNDCTGCSSNATMCNSHFALCVGGKCKNAAPPPPPPPPSATGCCCNTDNYTSTLTTQASCASPSTWTSGACGTSCTAPGATPAPTVPLWIWLLTGSLAFIFLLVVVVMVAQSHAQRQIIMSSSSLPPSM